ncbi:hypothetical protein K7432_016425, partial [Basidiobolus ranarum]
RIWRSYRSFISLLTMMRMATCCKSSPSQLRTDPLYFWSSSSVRTMKALEQATSNHCLKPLNAVKKSAVTC